MKKILITGGCGFVGRHLTKRLSLNSENQITVIDDLSTGVKFEDFPEHLKCNVHEVIYGDCVDFFEKSKNHYDVIFHLAAVVEGRMTIDHNPLKVAKDLIIDAAMFRWAVNTNPGKIVYFSSSAAYPIELQTREHNVALSEDMLDLRKNKVDMPDMSYGWSKLTGEFLSLLAVEKHNLKVAIYRPFSGFGEDQSMSYPFPSIIKRVIESDGVIDVWGTGEQSRDFIYIEDCITGILNTYEKIDDASALNLGTGIETTFKQLIETSCKVLGKENYSINALTDKPEGVFARYCNREKQDEYEFKPKYSLEDGIKIVADYIKQNNL